MSDIQERISSSMADKICQAVQDMNIEMGIDYIEMGDLGEEITGILSEIIAGDEVKAVISKKIIETIEAIDPHVAAKSLEKTWGELLGEFFQKIVRTFKPKK